MFSEDILNNIETLLNSAIIVSQNKQKFFCRGEKEILHKKKSELYNIL
jgi:hypothetical protein